jgi:hypothetical protein
MKFCTLDLQNKKKITVYFNFTKTNPYYHFQPCFKVKTSLGAPRRYSRAANSFTVARHASRLTLRGERLIRVSSGERETVRF